VSTRFEPIIPACITWRDGEPFSPDFNDVYFSSADGLGEACEVFLQGNHLATRWCALDDGTTFTIGELGFGSGLNYVLAWKLWLETAPASAKLVFYSTEKHPLRRDDLEKILQLWPELAREAALLCDAYPILTPGMHTLVFEGGRVVLHLMLGEALESFENLLVCGEVALETKLRAWHMDAWFLDGFAPSHNPCMWSSELLNTLGLLSRAGTTVATYSVAGVVRRALEEAGFQVLKKPGFGQKRHRLEAVFKAGVSESVRKPHTPWAISTPHKLNTRKAIVVGAGLAGCFTAHALALRGFHVTVLDEHDALAMGASNNPQTVLYPNVSAYCAPLTTWMLHAFLFATRTYTPWLEAGLIQGELDGILQLNVNAKAQALHASLQPWLDNYPELGVLVGASEASGLAGVGVNTGALFVPGAGWLDSRGLCEFLMQTSGITWQPNTHVEGLCYESGMWHVAGFEAPVVVLANGGGAASFEQTTHLPLTLFRGQMTAVKSTEASRAIKRPLCGVGHVLPERHGAHWVGASYHQGVQDARLDTADDEANLAKLAALPIGMQDLNTVNASWAGVRAKTLDHVPLVGPVPDVQAFKARFVGLSRDGAKYIAEPGAYYPGLYVCSGFGSRGLTSIPLSALYLASVISHEPTPLVRDVAQSLSPARFLVKQLKQTKVC
jgi:tRNA 5-methylaminomethyl-2-thiouridine biosynthesis bifunctional protein